jgi:hypothetical protein
MKAKRSNGVPGRSLKHGEPEVLRITGVESQRNGTSKLTAAEIDRIVKAARARKKKPRFFMEAPLSPDKKTKILTAVAAAESSLVHGEGRLITRESMRQLAGEVKRRGRSRLTAISSDFPST